MSLIARYVFREFFSTWLAVVLALSLMVGGNQFARALERAADSHLPSLIVPELAFVTFAQALPIIGPMSLMLGIVLALGRLGHDSEMTAIAATGTSPWRSTAGISVFALLFSLAIGWLTLDFAPAMASREQATLNDALRGAQLAAFEPGHFTQLPSSSVVVHVARTDPDGTLRDIVLIDHSGDRLNVVTAHRASYSSDPGADRVVLRADDGVRTEGRAGELEVRRTTFEHLETSYLLPDVRRSRTSRDFVPSWELAHSRVLADRAELQWRWALPVMCAGLAIIALPLSRLRPRQGRYARVLPALLIFFLYVNLLGAGRSAISRGTLAPTPGLWLIHIGVLVPVGAWFAWRAWRRRGRSVA